jgi:hypothetical protein
MLYNFSGARKWYPRPDPGIRKPDKGLAGTPKTT